MMFHSNVPKYLNYVIQILAYSIETSTPHSNSDTFLQTILELVNRGDSISVLILQTSVLNQVHGYRFR